MNAINQLSDLQLAILRELWRQGEATVAQVHAALQSERGLAVTTIATVLSRLEKRGIVRHRREGRQFVYSPAVTDRDVRRSALDDLTERVFQGDVAEVVNHLLTHVDFEPGDLERVQRMIEAKQRGLSRNRDMQERSDVDD